MRMNKKNIFNMWQSVKAWSEFIAHLSTLHVLYWIKSSCYARWKAEHVIDFDTFFPFLLDVPKVSSFLRSTSCALLFFGMAQKIYDLFISGCYGSLYSPYIIVENEKSRKVRKSQNWQLSLTFRARLSSHFYHSNILWVIYVRIKESRHQ